MDERQKIIENWIKMVMMLPGHDMVVIDQITSRSDYSEMSTSLMEYFFELNDMWSEEIIKSYKENENV